VLRYLIDGMRVERDGWRLDLEWRPSTLNHGTCPGEKELTHPSIVTFSFKHYEDKSPHLLKEKVQEFKLYQ